MSSHLVPLAEISKRLSQKLNPSVLRKLRHAHITLVQLQQRAILEKYGEYDSNGHIVKNKNYISTQNAEYSPNLNDDSDDYSLGEEEFEKVTIECEKVSEDAWLGYFNGYEILNRDEKLHLNGNKQCVELGHKNCDIGTLEEYFRAGICCFYVDLFLGSEIDKQKLIFNLRNCELKISQELGFPMNVSLFAMLSPRCQYTGIFTEPNDVYKMEKGELLTLTTDRQYSLKGSKTKIYVNGRFLIDECHLGDFILIGPTLQVRIISIISGDLNCEVMQPGILHSKSPVRFPGRCNRSRVSVEEIEDITFAREMGINVLVSYIPGTELYLKELQEVLQLLECDNMRLGCRVVLNEIHNSEDVQWIVDGYDMFVMEFTMAPKQEEYQGTALRHAATDSQILYLSSAAKDFIRNIYQQKKAIIMNTTLIATNQLFVDPNNWYEIFYYADKYIIKDDQGGHESFRFHLLQRAVFQHIIPLLWSSTPLYCDESQSGSDSIARACVASSLECNAAAILICAVLPDMPIKLAHFRPKVPIHFISPTKSSAEFVTLYHNVIYLYQNMARRHREFVLKGFLCGLSYLHCRKLVTEGQNVILMYSHDECSDLPDKYVIFKFNNGNLLENLNQL
ncbi:uncharacterized protein LOC133335868, partial [Musca vetustissima]|uniref:uncharacterized protein LOC133335868 n=1 Tax=Musca vetustissima TaxID=27455 RepID=UPI002AB744E9